MRRDAVVRGVSVTYREASAGRGDSVQLQQVMINLLQNALTRWKGVVRNTASCR